MHLLIITQESFYLTHNFMFIFRLFITYLIPEKPFKVYSVIFLENLYYNKVSTDVVSVKKKSFG